MTAAARLFADAFETEVLETAESGPPVDQWSVAGKNKRKSNPAGEDLAWWRENGPTFTQNWIDWRRRSKWTVFQMPDGKPAIEVEISVQLPGMDEVYNAFVDRVMQQPNGNLVIVDLKTGARSPESDMQLGMYRYGLWKQYDVQVEWGAYWMAREGSVTDLHQLTRYKPHMLESWFGGFVKAKKAEIFLPHVTFMCRACAMRDYCAAYGGRKSHVDPDFRGDQ